MSTVLHESYVLAETQSVCVHAHHSHPRTDASSGKNAALWSTWAPTRVHDGPHIFRLHPTSIAHSTYVVAKCKHTHCFDPPHTPYMHTHTHTTYRIHTHTPIHTPHTHIYYSNTQYVYAPATSHTETSGDSSPRNKTHRVWRCTCDTTQALRTCTSRMVRGLLPPYPRHHWRSRNALYQYLQVAAGTDNEDSWGGCSRQHTNT